MAKENVAKFFAAVHDSQALQGSLNGALANTAPEVLTEIASAKGFDFTVEELSSVMAPESGELSDGDMDAVSGGALPSRFVAQNALKFNFWKAVSPSRFQVGGLANSFGLGIPGPDFVQVMGDDDRNDSGDVDEVDSRSAADILRSL